MKKRSISIALFAALSLFIVAPLPAQEKAASPVLKAILKKKYFENKPLTEQEQAYLKEVADRKITYGLTALDIADTGLLFAPSEWPRDGEKYKTPLRNVITVDYTERKPTGSIAVHFTYDDLDDAIKEKASQLRIYPSKQPNKGTMLLIKWKDLVNRGKLKRMS